MYSVWWFLRQGKGRNWGKSCTWLPFKCKRSARTIFFFMAILPRISFHWSFLFLTPLFKIQRICVFCYRCSPYYNSCTELSSLFKWPLETCRIWMIGVSTQVKLYKAKYQHWYWLCCNCMWKLNAGPMLHETRHTKTSSQAPSYASPKIRPTRSLTDGGEV